ncbi:MAG: LamG domain-containing protein [Planctomycetaceae bacterium]|nr:LamG domain-containing protein [Planctomycetaceae bacterium]
MPSNKRYRGGFALVMVLLLVTVAAVLGMACLSASSMEMAGTENLRRATRARYLGESGVYHALALLRGDPDAPAAIGGRTSTQYQADGMGDTYAYTVSGGSGGQYTLTAIAHSGGLSQAVGATVKLSSPYNSLVTGKGPLTYWRLGETSGLTAREAIRSANGTYYNMTLGDTGALAGDGNPSARFNGYSSYVKIPNTSLYQAANGTIVLWFKPTSLPQSAALLSKNNTKDQGYNDQFEIQVNSQGRIGVELTRYQNTRSLSGGTVHLNQWHCVAATFGSAGMKLYVNGALAASNAYAGGLQGNSDPIILGASASNSPSGQGWPLNSYFRGDIDEVAVFTTAKSAQDIQQIYNAQLADVTMMSWDR